MKRSKYESWSRIPRPKNAFAVAPNWRSDPLEGHDETTWIPFGQGRTYSDTSVNPSAGIIDTSKLNRFIEFDPERGVLCCESGVTFADILELIVPHGWFLPVCPGTKSVSIGGTIGHDIHGKNQPSAGTIGCHVQRLELLRSSGERLLCSPDENRDLFRATIGGLGLTGLITWAELKLKPITSAYFETQRVRCTSLDDFYELARSSPDTYDLAWIHTFDHKNPGSKSIIIRGNHAEGSREELAATAKPPKKLRVPSFVPPILFNRVTMRVFSTLYYNKQLKRTARSRMHWDSFLFPQDSSHNSNYLYGRRGIYGYQALIPPESIHDAIPELLERTSRPRCQSLITVLKVFGKCKSPGMLSFSGPGVSIVCGFPNQGERTLKQLGELDRVVREAGGLLYPAKDPRMPAQMFQHSFPEWREFVRHVDPRFSSSFWRRVSNA